VWEGAFPAPNAGRQARLAAGARYERTLAAVACSRLILIEAPSSAYHGGMLRVGNITLSRGGDLMRFYTKQHQFYCGIDLHARTRYVCMLAQHGAILLHRNMPASPEPFLKAIAPYRDDLVVASAGKRYGTAGKKIGNAYLTWAFAEAAVLLLRNNAQ